MKPVFFGSMPDGTRVDMYTLESEKASCQIITYGGALRSLKIMNLEGKKVDVVLGFDTLDAYLCQDKFIGALIGRYANRIGNAVFSIADKEYCLAANDGVNHLHGGVSGFDKRIWNVKSATNDTLTLSLFSPDGDEGYPGNMCIEVTYHLTGSALSIDYHAVSDSDTVCNLTNHAYFNLAGHDSGSIAGHTIQIFADRYTPTDQFSIPTGEIQTVAGTHMDLREPTVIADHVDSDDEQLRWAGGYDHNWCINGETGQLRLAAVASSPDTGIVMETYTTQPGLQFYIGNYLDGCPNGKNGAVYGKHSGFCLETQRYPDSPNHAAFPDSLLRPGEEYHHITVYSFR